jgi:hypothetical protein
MTSAVSIKNYKTNRHAEVFELVAVKIVNIKTVLTAVSFVLPIFLKKDFFVALFTDDFNSHCLSVLNSFCQHALLAFVACFTTKFNNILFSNEGSFFCHTTHTPYYFEFVNGNTLQFCSNVRPSSSTSRGRNSHLVRAGRSGDRTQPEARFPGPIQTGPEAHPRCYRKRSGTPSTGKSCQIAVLTTNASALPTWHATGHLYLYHLLLYVFWKMISVFTSFGLNCKQIINAP